MRDEPKIAARPDVEEGTRPKTKPIVLPYPSIGPLFKGRDEFMSRLRQSLPGARGARTAIFSQALYGLGGIGKSRVAVEYAWAHADDYNALLFVVAETPEALRRNLAALAGTLVPQLDATDDAVKLAAVLDWLRANPGWFLILDNVDSKEALAEAERLLSELVGGHVVVTSRLADFSGHFQPLELDVLTIEDAAAFLLERTKDRRRVAPDDDSKARAVAEELGRLALALEQAAAYIAKRRLTFSRYLEQWRSNRDEVLAWFDPTVTDYPRSVAVTWQTSVAQLGDGGRRLLERLAWLAPEKVPESLLDVPVPGAEAENLRDTCDDLSAYSLVTRDADRPFFLVYRLVQDVTRRSLSGEAQLRSLVEALQWISDASKGDARDIRTWPRLEPLAPHMREVVTYADEHSIGQPTTNVTNQLYSKALHDQTEPLLRRALAIDEKSFGPDHPNVATDLNNLALLLQATNRLAEAEPLMRRALAIDEKSFGPDHPNVATGLNNLAVLLRATNRLAEAEPLMRRALAIDEKSFGPDHPNVAIRLNNLAAACCRPPTGWPRPSRSMRRALAIDEKSFGPDHPNVAIDLNNLAALLQATNRLAEAEPLMRRALAIDEKSFGPDHPNVGDRPQQPGQLLQDTNRLAEAEPLMRRALAIDEKSFGPDHPNVATASTTWPCCCRPPTGSARPSRSIAARSPSTRRASDRTIPDVAIRLNNLAQLLQATNRLAEAEPLMRRTVAIVVEFTRRTGYRHPNLDDASASYASEPSAPS